jgi:hypothetical protein
MAVPYRFRQLMMYLDEFELVAAGLSRRSAEAIESLCQRSSEVLAAHCRLISEFMTAEATRVFVRWKHRLTGTSPAVVPIWLPRNNESSQPELDDLFTRGFGVIDWAPTRGAEPELILWPAQQVDFSFYGTLGLAIVSMMRALIDATMRWVTPSAAPIPFWLIDPFGPSKHELAALEEVDAGRYKAVGIRRFWTA